MGAEHMGSYVRTGRPRHAHGRGHGGAGRGRLDQRPTPLHEQTAAVILRGDMETQGLTVPDDTGIRPTTAGRSESTAKPGNRAAATEAIEERGAERAHAERERRRHRNLLSQLTPAGNHAGVTVSSYFVSTQLTRC